MKYRLWMMLGGAVALIGTGAGAQTDLPSPSAEPGRLEAPQPEAPPGGAAGDAAENTKPATPAAVPVPTTTHDGEISPAAARLLADRTLKGGGPKFGLPPLRATLWPRGLPGWLDLSGGVSVGRTSRWENLAL